MTEDVSFSAFWDRLYGDGETPWDLGGPTPVFRRLLQTDQLPPGKMIVLGAGHGHDSRMFAAAGFDVTAVDFAPRAAAAMRALNTPRVAVTVLETDIFHLPAQFEGAFDYILEYTCFCAIDPSRRVEYADLVARLLKPGGRFVALAFPIGKRPGGPPFVVQPDEMIALLEAHGFVLLHREMPFDSAHGRRGVEELLIMQRTHA